MNKDFILQFLCSMSQETRDLKLLFGCVKRSVLQVSSFDLRWHYDVDNDQNGQ